MSGRVWVDASLKMDLNLRQIEILEHLCGYGAGLSKAIRTSVTATVTEEELTALIRYIAGEVSPVLRAVRDARGKVGDGLKPGRSE